jgi:hypothetical protein
VRVARRTASSDPSLVSVKGQGTGCSYGDASAGSAHHPMLSRVRACAGILRAAPIDGTFEFAAIPTGNYAVGLKPKPGMANLFVATDGINVGSSGVSGLEFVSTTQFGPLAATIVFEGGNPLPREICSFCRVQWPGWSGPAEVLARA